MQWIARSHGYVAETPFSSRPGRERTALRCVDLPANARRG